MKVSVIPARIQRPDRHDSGTETARTRVAAYCRVSTDREEQESSYEVQVRHYTDYINGNPAWQFAGIYADEGISATNTKKREGFMRMIDDCMAGKIDMLLTKSISRFARNTIDCLKYVRQLRDRRIPVVFEKENINTMDSKGEVLLTIMASLAQQESESLSKNIQLGLQFRFQNGQVMVNHNRFLGYTRREKGGPLVVVPEEAEIVRRIYREYLEGSSAYDIKRSLERDGVRNGAGSLKWNPSNIQQILTNEKYMGDALLQKTYTANTLDKIRVRNKGEVQQYYVENSHEAIVSRAVFARVQNEIARRSALVRKSNGVGHRYSGKFALTGKVICARCGGTFRRICWNNRGYRSVVWRCVTRVSVGADSCPARTVREEDLHEAVLSAVKSLMPDRSRLMDVFVSSLGSSLETEGNSELDEIVSRLDEIQKQIVPLALEGSDYSGLKDEMQDLKRRRDEIVGKEEGSVRSVERVRQMVSFLDSKSGEVLRYDDSLVRSFVDEVRVLDDGIEILLKNGKTFFFRG